MEMEKLFNRLAEEGFDLIVCMNKEGAIPVFAVHGNGQTILAMITRLFQHLMYQMDLTEEDAIKVVKMAFKMTPPSDIKPSEVLN